MTQVAEASILLRARSDPSLRGEVAKARAEVSALGQETRQGAAATGSAAQASTRLATAHRRQAAATDAAATSAGRLAAAQTRVRTSGQSGAAGLQNVAFQIGDIATQMGAGTAASIAFGQQLPQLLGGFGVLGAVAGAAVAVLVPLGATFIDLGESAASAADKFDALGKAIDAHRDLRSLAGDVKKLREEYGALTATTQALIEAQQEQSLSNVQAQVRQTVDALRELASLERLDLSAELRRSDGAVRAAIQRDFDLRNRRQAVDELRAAIEALNRAEGISAQAEAALSLRETLLANVRETGSLSDRSQDVVKALLDGADVLTRAAAATGEVETGLGAAAGQARAIADEAERAAGALTRLGDTAASRLQQARIDLDFRTDPVGRARARAEAEAGARVAEVRRGVAGLDPSDRRLAITSAERRARQVVSDSVAAAELIAERRARDAADRRTRRPAPSRGRAASRRDIAAEIGDEITVLERRTAARQAGSDALREAMIVEAQAGALRRAGLTLTDLETGGQRARAQEIARQSRALFELQSAEQASMAVTRDYGREIGLSYEEARTAVDAWRTATLEALDETAGGYDGLVRKVEALYRNRLARAYRQDRARAKDWASGVGTALDDIVEDYGNMARLSESLVTRSFRSMEDAFVSLAMTGKVELSSLVEFALRAFYQIAQASVIDLAQGGSGGLIGTLVGSLLGIGGVSVSGASTSGFGGVGAAGGFSPGAIPADPTLGGFFLHSGGHRTDAKIRQVPASLFDTAPRLHSGGLKPGEFPAILEDDERVLTRAQQTATAQSITGLARLAETGVATGSGTSVTVNVHGAPGGAEASARQDGDGLTIDILLEQIEGRMGQRIGEGRGLATPIQRRFELQPRGGL